MLIVSRHGYSPLPSNEEEHWLWSPRHCHWEHHKTDALALGQLHLRLSGTTMIVSIDKMLTSRDKPPGTGHTRWVGGVHACPAVRRVQGVDVGASREAGVYGTCVKRPRQNNGLRMLGFLGWGEVVTTRGPSQVPIYRPEDLFNRLAEPQKPLPF